MAMATPAQLTRMRASPSFAATSSKAALPLSSLDTSHFTAMPPISAATACARSMPMSKRATFAPLAASARAVASPRPEPPPVTIATCPAGFMKASPEDCWTLNSFRHLTDPARRGARLAGRLSTCGFRAGASAPQHGAEHVGDADGADDARGFVEQGDRGGARLVHGLHHRLQRRGGRGPVEAA